MSALGSSTDRDGGKELIDRAWRVIKIVGSSIERRNSPTGRAIPHLVKADLSYKELEEFRDVLVFCAHRLAFLEMVTIGMKYQEMHDAQAYAKFVEKKRNIEDMDIDELRVLLRGQ